MRKNRLVGVAYSEPIANWGGQNQDTLSMFGNSKVLLATSALPDGD